MLPSDQSLNADGATCCNINLRLIVHHEFMVIERPSQFLSLNHVNRDRGNGLECFGNRKSLQCIFQLVDLEWLLEVTYNGKAKELRIKFR